MTSTSNNIVNNCSISLTTDPIPVQTDMVITGSPVSSTSKVLSSDDYRVVDNKKKLKRKRKLATSTRSYSIAPTNVVPLITSHSRAVSAVYVF